MSNYLAIATVTACLKQLLQPAADIIGGATVTTTRPDLMTNSGTTTPGVNIFMYQVMPNAAWRNEDLPARRADGTLITRPRVAIDLYYMISFHGNESELEPQRLLGSVVRTMHEKPVLGRDLISATVDATSYLNSPLRSNLEDEIELVKFTPTALSTEEISKLWAAFQTPYVLTAVYHGTVVLIDGLSDPFEALPVQSRNIYVYPYGQPAIDRVVSQDGSVPITWASTVLIQGRSLGGDPSLETKVRIGDNEIVATQVTSSTITLPLGEIPNFRAGILNVQVIQPRMIGTPPVEHVGSESNIVPIVVHAGLDDVNVLSPTGSSTNRSADVQVGTDGITIGASQRVVLFLNEATTDSPAFYSFVAPDRGSDEVYITIPVTGMKSGEYIVSLMIDGARTVWNPAFTMVI